ncbi:MAG: glycosyltransferase, partial [Deltaproteobacteria bacterium]|nr:glycosyltransferase [Deltaproteobacteria bacterium]
MTTRPACFTEPTGGHAGLARSRGWLRAPEHVETMKRTAGGGERHDMGPFRTLTRMNRDIYTALEILRSEGVHSLFAQVYSKFQGRKRNTFPSIRVEPLVDRWHHLNFPRYPEPLVSIVMPVAADYRLTFNSLKSIRKSIGDKIPFEVILVGDVSDDDTTQMLIDIKGIRVCCNSELCGFFALCNLGAGLARGKFLVFLREDTEVQAGWLDTMIQTFSIRPDAGMVGAKTVLPSGRLCEAGGIIWPDGTASEYGFNDDPFRPEYSYLHESDFCSGACFMIRHRFYKRLGQEDISYKSGFYEKVDLSFRVREVEKKVYSQPGALVVRHETFGSGGYLAEADVEALENDRLRFCQRWHGMLKRQYDQNERQDLDTDFDAAKRILVIDARTLLPDQDSGSLRMFYVLGVLQDLGYRVTFAADTLEYRDPYTSSLQDMGVEVLYRPYTASIEQHLLDQGGRYTAVILSRADIAEKYSKKVRALCTDAKLIFDTVDLHFLREERKGRLENNKRRIRLAEMRRRQELGIMGMSDVTLVVSPAEKELLIQKVPHARIEVVSNILPVYGRAATFEERRDMVFIGNFIHSPNVDAMVYFVKEVLPHIRNRINGIRLHIVGNNTPSVIKKLEADDVLVDGYVKDLAPLFNSILLSVAPLRYGSGVKGKINMSMSYGVPVVATSCASEGAGLRDGKDVLIADTRDGF